MEEEITPRCAYLGIYYQVKRHYQLSFDKYETSLFASCGLDIDLMQKPVLCKLCVIIFCALLAVQSICERKLIFKKLKSHNQRFIEN